METLLYIGRFQPFHKGHRKTLEYALRRADRVVVGLGSCNVLVSFKNPWDAYTREAMISDSLNAEQRSRLNFIHLNDYPESHDTWVAQVREKMAPYGEWGIVGLHKDASSFYLDLFPGIEVVSPPYPDLSISATTVRSMIFGHPPCSLDDLRDIVPNGTLKNIKSYIRG
jgi:bifunctional NMN adenylyltransferase/nudix hydrolase